MADFAELCIQAPGEVTKLLQSYAAGGDRIDEEELRQVFADLEITPLVGLWDRSRITTDCATLVKTLAREFKRSRKEIKVLRSLRSCKSLTESLAELRKLFFTQDASRSGELPRDIFLRCLQERVTIVEEQVNSIVGPFLTQMGTVNYRIFLSVIDPYDTHHVLGPETQSKALDLLDLLRVLRDFVIQAKQCGVSLLESFELLDINKDGKITATEFMQGLKRLGLVLSHHEANAVLKLFCEEGSSLSAEPGIRYFQFLRFVDNDCSSQGDFSRMTRSEYFSLDTASLGANAPFVAGVTVKMNSTPKVEDAKLCRVRGHGKRRSRTCAGLCHQLSNIETYTSPSSLRKETYSCVLYPHTGEAKLIERVAVYDPRAKPCLSKLALQRNQVSRLGYVSDLALVDNPRKERSSIPKSSTRKVKKSLLLSRYKRVYKESRGILSLIEQGRQCRDEEGVTALLSQANDVLQLVMHLAVEFILGCRGLCLKNGVEKLVRDLVNTSSAQDRVVLVQMSTLSCELANVKQHMGEHDLAMKLRRLGGLLLERMKGEWSLVEDSVHDARGCFFLEDPQCSISCTYYDGVKTPEEIAKHLWNCYLTFQRAFHFHLGILKCSKTREQFVSEVLALTKNDSSWYEFVNLLSAEDEEYSHHLVSIKSSFSSLELFVLDAIYHKALLKATSGEDFAAAGTLAQEIMRDKAISRFLNKEKLRRRLEAEEQCLKALAENHEGEILLTFEHLLASAVPALNSFNLDFIQITLTLSQLGLSSFTNNRESGSHSAISSRIQAHSRRSASNNGEAIRGLVELVDEIVGNDALHALYSEVYLASSRNELELSKALVAKRRRRVAQLCEEYVYSSEGRAKVKTLVAAMTEKSSCQTAKRKAEVAAVQAVRSRFLSKLRTIDAGRTHWQAAERYSLKAVNVIERHWGHQSTRCADVYFQLGEFYRSSRSRDGRVRSIDAYSTALHILDSKQGPKSVGISFLAETLAKQFESFKETAAAALHYEIGAAAAESCFSVTKDKKHLDRAVQLYHQAYLKFKSCGGSQSSQVLALSEKLVELQLQTKGVDSIDYVEALVWNAEAEFLGESPRQGRQTLCKARSKLKTLSTSRFKRKKMLEERISRLLRSDAGDLVRLGDSFGAL